MLSCKRIQKFLLFFRPYAKLKRIKFPVPSMRRVVNGGGYIDREYGLGLRRTDLLIRKPLTDHYGGPIQRVVMELKILRRSLERTIEDGLRQTAAYMDIAGSVDEGHLIIFDRSQTRSWDERIWHRPYEQDGRTIMVWGM